jgi:membrane protease YdiL (CAAX protease family)
VSVTIAARTTADRSRARAAGVAALAGTGALLFRGSLLALPASPRTVLVGAVTVAVTVVSVAAPVRRGTRRASPTAILAVGLGAVLLAAAVAGPVVPAPLGAWALPLAVLAGVAEEAVFRRAMFAWLEPRGPLVAIGSTAVAFALLHLPLYGPAAMPVDLGAGLLLSWQRWASGTWTVPAATHAAANVLAVTLR